MIAHSAGDLALFIRDCESVRIVRVTCDPGGVGGRSCRAPFRDARVSLNVPILAGTPYDEMRVLRARE